MTTLTRQRVGPDVFEVIVADDGSTDGTRAVVDEFSDRLDISYHFQEDLGFRAGTARNAGARLARAPLLVFLDSGAAVGPDFVHHHRLAHRAGTAPRMSLGYAYGYNPDDPMPGIEEALRRWTPEQTVAHFVDEPAFRDLRHASLVACDFDLSRRALPWNLSWTINCSLPADVFWAVGGFDDTFVGWGAEDLEFAFRLHQAGVGFHVNRDAWAIESPHERDWDLLDKTFLTNMDRFLNKHREPIVEIGTVLVAKLRHLEWDECVDELRQWTHAARDRDVADEIERAVRDSGPGERMAIFGCGARVPGSLPPAVLLDVDREKLDAALAGGPHVGHHAVGVRTPLPDQVVDTVVLTSRLGGLRQRWNDDLLTEAQRIGRRVVDVAVP